LLTQVHLSAHFLYTTDRHIHT